MRRISRYILPLLLMLVAVTTLNAQRRVTPVDNPDLKSVVTPSAEDENKPKRPASVIEKADSRGRVVLIDTITGREYHDSVEIKEPKRIYPRWHAVAVGYNFWDTASRLLGADYGLGSVWVELSLYNWLKPYVEVGVGSADHWARDDAFHYKSSIAPFFKVGMNYNFLYRGDSRYSVYVGLRFGYTTFSYEIVDGSTSNGYWDETAAINVPSQSTSVLYAEGLAGVRVNIVSNLYLGWEAKFHFLLKQSKMEYGRPWYIPGYGTRGSTFAANFSVIYQIPLSKKRPLTLPGADFKTH